MNRNPQRVKASFKILELFLINPCGSLLQGELIFLGFNPYVNHEHASTSDCRKRMDAFSHALESFVTMRANPLSDLLSLRGIEIISQNLRKAYTKGTHNLESRYAMCFGVCLGTMAIRSSGMGVVHATCYPPAMKYHLTHGLAISLMMPYIMETNLISNVEKYAAIASAMGEKVDELSLEEASAASVKAVRRLIKDLGLAARLREVGARKEDFPEFARTVVNRYAYHLVNNPRNLTEEDILRICESAW